MRDIYYDLFIKEGATTTPEVLAYIFFYIGAIIALAYFCSVVCSVIKWLYRKVKVRLENKRKFNAAVREYWFGEDTTETSEVNKK